MTNSGRPLGGSTRRVHGGSSGRGRRLAGRFALAMLMAATAAGAGAQSPTARSGETPPWVRARLEGRLDAASRTAVEQVIDSVHAVGLPAEPLVDKALEGTSKGAPREAVLRALRRLAADLGAARAQLGANSLTDELNAGASALRGGVEADALRRLRRERPGQPLVVALGVLSDLVARGVPPAAASRAVIGLTQVGVADEQLVAFRRDVERDIGIGAPPAAAVSLRESSLRLNRTGGAGSQAGPPAGRPRP